MSEKKIPVILNTDIGGDIDDTWALAVLLRSHELDTKLVVPCLENPEFPFGRTKVAAKQMEMSGYGHIPVAAGLASGVRAALAAGKLGLQIIAGAVLQCVDVRDQIVVHVNMGQ